MYPVIFILSPFPQAFSLFDMKLTIRGNFFYAKNMNINKRKPRINPSYFIKLYPRWIKSAYQKWKIMEPFHAMIRILKRKKNLIATSR